MKKLLLALLLFSSFSVAMAFDWKPLPNEKLRANMLDFATSFMQQAQGSPAELILRDFIARQRYLAETQPYAWIAETHQVVDKLKQLYPPKVDDRGFEAMMRRYTLRLLDYPLHVDNRSKTISQDELAAYNQATNTYLATTRQQALDWLSHEPPAPGKIDICLIYNMGYFIRTSARTFAIDICWHGTKEEAKQIARAIDVIFVSHPHSDHYTPLLLNAVVEQGKPVVLPAQEIPGFSSPHAIAIESSQISARLIAGIEVRSLYGAQEVGVNDSVPNNLYLLSFDGWTMLHQGDNENIPIQSQLAFLPKCDLVFAPAWKQIQALLEPVLRAEGANEHPPLFFPTHQNELEHVVRHRESYWELFNRRDRMGNPNFKYPPFILMDNGESIVVSK